MTIYKKVLNVQTKLKAPKGQYNSFGKYSYRNAEDILEAVKPLLKEEGLILNVSDEIILIGDRYYVKATAKLIDIDTGESVESYGLAREDETKKGMDLSQVTGSCSSYSRKYALNGLLAIDSSELDPDKTNTHGQENKVASTSNPGISEAQEKRLYAIGFKAGVKKEQILSVIKKDFNLDDVKKLNKDQYNEICARLEAKIN